MNLKGQSKNLKINTSFSLEKKIKKLQENKFAILDTIRNINCENTLPVTISIGVGREGDSLYEDLQRANGALDLALGRGGDQAVVKTQDKFEFYGGKSKSSRKNYKKLNLD